MRERPNDPAPTSTDDHYGHLAEDAGMTDEEFRDTTGVKDSGQKATDTGVSSLAAD